MTTSVTPYANLTPDVVLDAIESLGLITDGHLLTLNSYENRVYQVGIDEAAPLIAKFYRPHRWSDAAILEEHQFSQELANHELPVVPPLRFGGQTLHYFNDYRFALTLRQGGRAPNLEHAAVREWLGRLLGRIHAVGAVTAFTQRPTLNCAHFGIESRDFLLANQCLPSALLSTYLNTVSEALVQIDACYERAGTVKLIRLHGDCHLGNVLWADDGPHFVDFDDARQGPAIQDLWMLLAGDREEMRQQLDDVLAGYEDFCEFNWRELQLIEALRTLRIIHYAAWLARRWDDPAFPAAFPWFNTAQFWHDHILQLQEQITAMAAGALWTTGND
ncbi:stress response serine/threonine protein kinase YihE [Chromatium okenii]|uniref:serine/threonine protein kinase n=1 Tax=Chromatium okenii TaxID=61644 RepID=UPI0019054788|nr:serine/threonine protein kinase [Chromatium okenii]MBK1640602.1 stress response serine/threonine protein kinase YihE [Chromatium okenii]